MKIKDLFEIETRRIIYHFILKNPGIHLRELSRKLQENPCNLKYHIKKLEKNGYIIQKKEDGYLRFYISQKISNGDKIFFTFLRKKITRNMIIIILYNIAASQREMCELLDKSPATINVHVKKLLENNIIELAPKDKKTVYRIKKPKILFKNLAGREIVYRLKDPFTIYRLLSKYRDTILDEETNIILDGINISIEEETIKIKSGIFGTETYNNYINCLFDVFPHPYHV